MYKLRLPKHMSKVTPVFLKIGVNPSLSILKYVSETAPWCFIHCAYRPFIPLEMGNL